MCVGRHNLRIQSKDLVYRPMVVEAVDYLQGRITTAKESGPHNCPEKEKKYIYIFTLIIVR